MTRKLETIVVAGGIGCGKSVVCKILSTLGYAVYDCDSRAKSIMNSSQEIMQHIADHICREAIVVQNSRCKIDRKRLAAEVFNDISKLKKLNSLVHTAVKADIEQWRQEHAHSGYGLSRIFIETALLKQSGLEHMADRIWEVTAPLETRIQRAMHRDNAVRESVEARIKSQEQTHAEAIETCGSTTVSEVDVIINDDVRPVLPQVLELLCQTSPAINHHHL